MFKRKPSGKEVKKAAAPKRASKPGTVKGKGPARLKPKSGLVVKRGPLPKRRASAGKPDLGIGPVDLEPRAGAPETVGIIAARALLDKKATDVMVLDVREVSGLCDEMCIATARSVPHLNALGDAVEEALRMHGEKAIHRDGLQAAEPDWLLLDYGNLMIHLFRAEARSQYRLEDYYEAAQLLAKWKND